MNPVFEIISWLAMAALVATSIPQIALNYKRKSTQGVSRLMFGLLFFGLITFFVRSLFVTDDIILKLNYGAGSLIVFAANLQFIYYSAKKKNA